MKIITNKWLSLRGALAPRQSHDAKWVQVLTVVLLLLFAQVANAEEPLSAVHFSSNADELDEMEMASLSKNAVWMNENRDAVIILEGHCDEFGDGVYNMQLGDRRARTVKEQLIAQGVRHDRVIMVVSYGSTRPVNSEHTNEAWRANRRVEFVLR